MGESCFSSLCRWILRHILWLELYQYWEIALDVHAGRAAQVQSLDISKQSYGFQLNGTHFSSFFPGSRGLWQFTYLHK